MPPNGRPCAKAPKHMTNEADAHLRPKLIGARIKRTEDPRLLTGLGSFVPDRQVTGSWRVAFRRSDHAHARIHAVDVAAAQAMSGVAAVFIAADFEETVKPLRATSRMKGYYATPIRALAHEKVRYVGEPVAGIVAESRYLAEDAAERVAIEFEPLPHVADPAGGARCADACRRPFPPRGRRRGGGRSSSSRCRASLIRARPRVPARRCCTM